MLDCWILSAVESWNRLIGNCLFGNLCLVIGNWVLEVGSRKTEDGSVGKWEGESVRR